MKEIIYPWWEIEEPLNKPEPPSWLIDNITELSKITRTLHFLYVTFLVYCGLTILSSTDRKIILDETARLPVIGSELPYASFMLVAPLTAIFLFVYFQLHLNALIRTIDDLRINYAPIGKGRLYPWMIILVDEHESGAFQRVERIIISVSLWWLLPIVQLLFFLWALKKAQGWHQFELLLLFTGGTLVFWFWYGYEAVTFKPEETEGMLDSIKQLIRRHRQKIILALCTMFFPLYIGIVIPTSWFYIDLHNQILINEQKEEYGNYLADFQEINLERANLFNTVLKRANLQRANFSNAQLEHANLEQANLSFATLLKASLKDVNLQRAILVSAVLNGANLQKADFKDANLEGAYLRDADLTEAKNLSIEQLLKVHTLYQAKIDAPLESQLKNINSSLLEQPLEEKTRKEREEYLLKIKANDETDGITNK